MKRTVPDSTVQQATLGPLLSSDVRIVVSGHVHMFEAISFAVTVATFPPPQAPTPSAETSAYRADSAGARKVRDTVTGEVADWAIYLRDRLTVGASFTGPAIIDEAETSTLVGAGWRGRITPEGYIELIRDIA